MELKEFVSTTISQIVEGVIDAREKLKGKGAIIVPPVHRGLRGDMTPSKSPTILNDGDQLTALEFDVALTRSEATETKGGVGVFLGAVGLGSQGQSTAGDSSLSRVKFEVPIVLPVQKDR